MHAIPVILHQVRTRFTKMLCVQKWQFYFPLPKLYFDLFFFSKPLGLDLKKQTERKTKLIIIKITFHLSTTSPGLLFCLQIRLQPLTVLYCKWSDESTDFTIVCVSIIAFRSSTNISIFNFEGDL